MKRFMLAMLAIRLTAPLLAAAEPPPEVDIRAEDGKVLVAADQIRSYDLASHTLTLAPRVREQLARKLKTARLLPGVPFVIAVGGKKAYEGKFTTILSSTSISSPVIVLDTPGLKEDQLQLQLGYPSADFFKGEDPRSEERIRAALKAAGKLTDE